MVPHKFYPGYLLVKLYDETGQFDRAVYLARDLLDKKIKVPSRAIEEMKEELEKIIADNEEINSINIKKVKGKNYTKISSILIKQQFW